jgi:hypothetical protein
MALQVTGQAQGIVLTASQKAGAPASVSTGWHNELLKSDLLPRYANLVQAGVVFGVGYAAAALAAPSATASGSFTLYNPIGSGKNLVLMEVTAALTTFTAVATTICAIGAYTFTNQTPTALTPGNTPLNALVGAGGGSVAKTYTAATIVGGNTFPIRQVGNTGILTPVGFAGDLMKDEVAGALVVAPGSGFGLAATATAADDTIQVCYTWAELPI